MFAAQNKSLMKKTILALSMLAVVFTSCKKDNDDDPVTPTKENLTGSYKITAATLSSGGTSVDIFNDNNFFEACDRDDIYKLNADLTYDIQDAGQVCSPDNNYTGGSWALVGTSSINIDGDVYTIKSWNGKTLVAEMSDSGITATVTYVKQ